MLLTTTTTTTSAATTSAAAAIARKKGMSILVCLFVDLYKYEFNNYIKGLELLF